MDTIWDRIKAAVKEKIPGHSYEMWIEPLEFDQHENDRVALISPNSFFKKRVKENYGELIASEIKALSGKECTLFFEVASGKQNENPQQKTMTFAAMVPSQEAVPSSCQQHLPNFSHQSYSGRLLRKEYTFDKFVVGNGNDFAYSAALSLATRRNGSQNSLFLLSQTGLGKSHLTQAIGHQILNSHPSDRVYYITAEDFASEMISAFRNGSIEKFKEKYRNQCDVLLLEDIHFLTGKERTQVELALALDYLYETNKKIIFTSCYLPTDIPKLSDSLRSRISSGLISNIEPPNFATRVRILRKKAKQNNLKIPTDVIDYLASELTENVRQLESGLFGIAAKSSLLGVPIDISLAESVVKTIARQQKAITVEAIKKLVCQNFNLSIKDIISKSRKQQIVRPRQIAIFLARRYTDQPLQSIGKSFNRQHATAIHAINAVENAIKTKSPVKRQVEYLSQKLESGKF